jgi:hypothetical protein
MSAIFLSHCDPRKLKYIKINSRIAVIKLSLYYISGVNHVMCKNVVRIFRFFDVCVSETSEREMITGRGKIC